MAGLVDVLDIVLAETSPRLVPPARGADLRDVAALLPAILHGGFEIRLVAGGTVDLGQNIECRDGVPTEIARQLYAGMAEGNGALERGWARIARFLAMWDDPATPWRERVLEVWLEVDMAERRRPLSAPSVFLRLEKRPPGGEEATAVVESLATALGTEPSEAALDIVRRCVDARPTGAWVSHVGVMLSRATGDLRLNVARVPGVEAGRFLHAIGWAGDETRVERLLERVEPVVDSVTLAVDAGRAVGPRLGIECAIRNVPAKRSRQQALLDILIELDCCTPAERDALLGLPYMIVPPTTRLPWPTGLIAEDIARPGLSGIAMGLSHVKIDVVGREDLRAKAYVYCQPERLEEPATPPASGAARGGASALANRSGAPPAGPRR